MRPLTLVKKAQFFVEYSHLTSYPVACAFYFFDPVWTIRVVLRGELVLAGYIEIELLVTNLFILESSRHLAVPISWEDWRLSAVAPVMIRSRILPEMR